MAGALTSLGPFSRHYSPNLVEGELCELRNDGVLRSLTEPAWLCRPLVTANILHLRDVPIQTSLLRCFLRIVQAGRGLEAHPEVVGTREVRSQRCNQLNRTMRVAAFAFVLAKVSIVAGRKASL